MPTPVATCPTCHRRMRSRVTSGPHPTVLAFLGARCVPDPAGVIGSAELWAALQDYIATRPDLFTCSQREIGLSLGRNHNLHAVRLSGGRRAWAGLRFAQVGEAPVPVVTGRPGATEAPVRHIPSAADRRRMREDVASTLSGWMSNATVSARGTQAEASSTATDLYASLCAYTIAAGLQPVTIQAMGRYLANKGMFAVTLPGPKRGWYGIKPKPVDTTPTP